MARIFPKEISFKADMDKLALGSFIVSQFYWGNYGLLKYDKENEEILLNEQMLMGIIKMVNPAQRDRKIKILSVDEWLDING